MTNYLTTSEERDQFIQWLENLKETYRLVTANKERPKAGTTAEKEIAHYEHFQGAYEAVLFVLAHIKTGGKL